MVIFLHWLQSWCGSWLFVTFEPFNSTPFSFWWHWHDWHCCSLSVTVSVKQTKQTSVTVFFKRQQRLSDGASSVSPKILTQLLLYYYWVRTPSVVISPFAITLAHARNIDYVFVFCFLEINTTSLLRLLYIFNLVNFAAFTKPQKKKNIKIKKGEKLSTKRLNIHSENEF